ncbi:acyl-CoA dehydrogenase family protein [Nocardia sp. NPDC049149]|uniref:acyl-CoA dehydrogenase family protein n=1 Tax=Nocardia sp. NPDC049149 TaxID=3364315 RepID=UPI00370FA4FB
MSGSVVGESMDAAASDYLDAAEILSRAKNTAAVLREHAVEIEQNRQLPQTVVDLLRGTGVFRMAMPKTWGGPELTSVQQTEVVEALATGDASAAWCAMIGADSGIYSGYLQDSVAREMFPSLDMVVAGFVNPIGRAERVPGGYLISGRWPFGSGVTHCDWLAAGCLVYRDGELEPDTDGDPTQWRVMMARPSDFEIHDTWYTTGLAGTGSRDYSVSELFVPEEHSFTFAIPHREGLLHRAPDAIVRKMPGVPLGVARAALDYVRSMAATRVDRTTGKPWGESYRVQMTIAEAEMDLAAARSAVFASLERQWHGLANAEPQTADERVATALARHKAFQTARSIVVQLFNLVGGSAIYRPSPLDRWLRDVNTMCQHADAGVQSLQSAGELLLGGNVPQKTLLW